LNASCCHNTAAQDVFVSKPLLAHLTIWQKLTWHGAWMLSGVQLGALRSLRVEMDLCHAWFLRGCTQLKALKVLTPNLEGASVFAQLTGLTRLQLQTVSVHQGEVPAAEQSELGSALASLSNLHSLHVNVAPVGPVAHALSQLTAFTELTIHLSTNLGFLTLPSCVKLTSLYYIAAQNLASIQAPKLQDVDAWVTLKLSDLGDTQAAMQGCAQGMQLPMPRIARAGLVQGGHNCPDGSAQPELAAVCRGAAIQQHQPRQ
jgi:hypothetical protein